MGSTKFADVGNLGLDLQCGGIFRDHADDMEAAERSREELPPRLQSASAVGLFGQDGK